MNQSDPPIDGMDLGLELGLGEGNEVEALFEALFTRFLQAVDIERDPEGLVLQFLSMHTWMRTADDRRKAENKKLLAMAKGWEAVKRRFTPKLLAVIELHGKAVPTNEHSRKIGTLLGAIYRQLNDEWSVSLEPGSAREKEAVESMLDELRTAANKANKPIGRHGAIEELRQLGMIVMEPRLTDAGKERAKQLAIALLKDRGEMVTWARVTPPGYKLRVVPAKGPMSLNPAARRLLDESRLALQIEEATHDQPTTDVDIPEGLANE